MKDEAVIRIGFFAGIFFILVIFELLTPRRHLHTKKPIRWFSNLGITFLNTALLRVLFPVLAIDMALLAQQHGWGIFNTITISSLISVIAGVLVFDLAFYLQHVILHAIPVFWRLHMVHHTDMDIDVTTGMRFHPLEVSLSTCTKLAVIYLLGLPVLSIFIFEILLNATSMFNHSNIFITKRIDWGLRLFLVTPDMHRVHHSVEVRETNSNYGFNLTWWDHLFGTYIYQPAKGHEEMVVGLSQFRNAKHLTLPWLLALPFIGKLGTYSSRRYS